MFRVVLVFLSLVFASSVANAASIELLPEKVDGRNTIIIRGEIAPGDDEQFERIVFNADTAVVLLASPGGDVASGISISKLVKLKGYDTIVMPDSICASMCGIIWLSGKERFAYSSSLIGFHAASRQNDGTESGAGTGQVAIYLYQLGFSPSAIAWLTSSRPNEMLWLDENLARQFGIGFTVLNYKPVPQPVEAPEPAPSSNFSMLADRDIFGFDLGEPRKNSNQWQCGTICADTPNCSAFTFNRQNSLCYLKSGGKEVMWNKNAVSGHLSSLQNDLKFLKIIIVNSTRLEGTTFLENSGVTLEQCAVACDESNQCSGFEFERQPSGSCRLKSGKLKRVKKPRLTAGVKTSE
jgi:hypothetical protein